MTGLEFVKGDIVALKSGGPAMTVESIGNYAEGLAHGPEKGAKCIWFEGQAPGTRLRCSGAGEGRALGSVVASA
ncbi:DUF2158 domain-containing protein [Azotobacter sp. CWF10]